MLPTLHSFPRLIFGQDGRRIIVADNVGQPSQIRHGAVKGRDRLGERRVVREVALVTELVDGEGLCISHFLR